MIWIPLFWGSIWGLTEASLGHILHQIPILGMAGFVMFPIGMFYMVQAYRYSGQLSIMFLTAFVAANLKLIDLFLPAHTPFAVINPAVAILCESLAVGLFFGLKDPRKILSRLDIIFIMVFVWRLFYGIVILSLGFFFPVQNFSELGSSHIIGYFLLGSAVNAILIYTFYKFYFSIHSGYFPFPTLKIKQSIFFHHVSKRPALHTIPLVVVAIAVELFLF